MALHGISTWATTKAATPSEAGVAVFPRPSVGSYIIVRDTGRKGSVALDSVEKAPEAHTIALFLEGFSAKEVLEVVLRGGVSSQCSQAVFSRHSHWRGT